MRILLSCFECKNIDDFDEIVRTFALSVFGGAKTPSSPNVHNKTNQGFNLVSKGLNNGGLGCLMYWSFISTVAISLEVVLLIGYMSFFSETRGYIHRCKN